ncbi:MAG: carboxypeptidase-like regulatory domain-containing protein, partial [Chitinophagales bacterium]
MYLRLGMVFSVMFLGLFSFVNAQIKLTGKVTNSKNEPLSGVSVKITGAAGGTTTDIEGRFSLNLSTGKKYVLEFSAIGYQAKPISEVEVIDGQVNELNIVLETETKNLEGVVVKAQASTARKETTASLISFQKNT